MKTQELNVVTGAFSYTGKYIARRLLSSGKRVRTLTGHPTRPHPFGGAVEVAPLDFTDSAGLVESLAGATTLYNTYWVRFPYARLSFEQAIENTKILIRAASEAGVRRIVHISVTKPSADSPLPYFRGKAATERAVADSGLSYAIVRPTVIFGAEDVLVNNVAWLLRRAPVFGVPGSGRYRLQPVSAEDVAEIAVRAGESNQPVTLDAAGPETYTFHELVKLIADRIQSRAKVIHLSPALALLVCGLVGYLVNDVLLTRDELAGLMANLLVSDSAPAGQARFSDWLAQNAARVGTRYASELDRHFRA